jgi:hypothetical protein
MYSYQGIIIYVHTRNTRMSQLEPLVMPKSEGKFFDRAFEYIVPRLWNALPPDLRNVIERKTVKRRLKKNLFLLKL